MLYYYLLRNNTTHTVDTIKASSEDELNTKVVALTTTDVEENVADEDNSSNTGLYWGIGIILALALCMFAVPLFVKK